MSQYVISGKERKLKKKQLHKLKYYVKMFWYYEDINNVYGLEMDENECKKILDMKKKEIKVLEDELSETSLKCPECNSKDLYIKNGYI